MSDQKKDELNISPELFKEIRNEICYSKDELHDWIKTYLKIDLPNTTISENSNGNPMDMVWWCYNNAIHSSGKTSKKAMFVASRGGMKTLGASIIELLMVSHAKRDVVHIGAILKTAKRCYQYFQGFFRQNGFDDLLFRDSNGNIKQPVMEKTILSNGTSLEILPCTLAACNDPESLVIRGSEKVKIKDLRIGDKIRGIDIENNTFKEVEIQNIKNVLKPSFLLKFTNGIELICSSDHLILTNYGWIPASRLQTKHNVVCDGWNSNEKSQWEQKFESYKKHEYFYDFDGLPVIEAKKYNNFDDLEKTKMKEKIFVGHRKLISIKINQDQFSNKNFVCNGIVQHNCNGPHTPFVCIGGDVFIKTISNKKYKMKDVFDMVNSGESLFAKTFNHNTGRFGYNKILKAYYNGKKDDVYNVKFDGGEIVCTSDHKLLTQNGYKHIGEISEDDFLILENNLKYRKDVEKRKHKDTDFPKINFREDQTSSKFEQVLLGSLLGDGGVYKKTTNNGFYSETHSKKQKSYLEWKLKFFQTEFNTASIHETANAGFLNTPQCRLRTGNSEYWNQWVDFKKTFKDVEKLDALGLAVWYMDDGNAGRIFGLNTQGFSYSQSVFLSDFINKKFGFHTHVMPENKKDGRVFYRIEGTTEDIYKLYKISGHYFPECMMYKLSYLKKIIKTCPVCKKKYFNSNRVGRPSTTCSDIICFNLHKKNVILNKINTIEHLGSTDVYDITIEKNHNMVLDNGLIVHQCLDEIDAVQDMQGYDDISGIPVKTKDGKPPIEIGISTMKTASGLVAQEINAAPKTGLEVFYWNIIDLTKKCPDSRSGTKKIPIYANLDTLEAISEEEWKDRTDSERKNFEKREGLEGCLSRCKMFSACLGNLKNQTSDSHMLNDVEFTEQKIFSKAPEWVNAQLLCRKPSLEGIIYSRFTNKGNIKSYQQMYEIFTGQPWPHKRNCSFDDLRSEFSKAGMRPNMAVDFGDHLAVLLLIYTDGKDRSYVVKEKTFTATDDAELAHWATTNWGKYDVNMVYADPASPSGIRLLTKAGFVCHHKVNKDVWGGINTVRRFINVPGTNRSALFVHESCENLIYEFPRYSRKYNKSLDVFMEDPVKKEDHSLDCLRYYLHTKYDGMEAHLGFFDDHIKEKDKRTEAPDVEQIAIENGIMGFVDNSDDFIRDEETGELRKKTDVEKNNESGGGGFSFF